MSLISSKLCITSFLRCVTPTPEVIVDFSMLCITSFLRCVTPDFGKVIDYKKIESDFVSGKFPHVKDITAAPFDIIILSYS